MQRTKKSKKTSYDKSLPRLFIWAGADVFVVLLILCVGLGLIIFFSNRLDADGIKLVLWCFLMVIPVSYTLPMMSLLKVWRQERVLGIYWKDRSDHDQPVQERDWYLVYNRGGFLLCHRAYIQRILNVWEVEQPTDLGRERIYCMKFEDICGKKHTVKFSSANERKKFKQWYQKKACINKNTKAE